MRVLRRGSAGAGIRLRTLEFNRNKGVASHIASNSVVGSVVEATVQRGAVIRLRLVIGDDDQLLLIVDIDDEVALFTGNLVGLLRRGRRAIQIGMMVHIAVRRLVLQGKGIALLNVRHIRIVNLVPVHIEVVNRNLGRGVAHVLKGYDVVSKAELQLLRAFNRLVMLAENIGIIGLRG